MIKYDIMNVCIYIYMNDSNYMFEQLHVLKVSLFEDETISPAQTIAVFMVKTRF